MAARKKPTKKAEDTVQVFGLVKRLTVSGDTTTLTLELTGRGQGVDLFALGDMARAAHADPPMEVKVTLTPIAGPLFDQGAI